MTRSLRLAGVSCALLLALGGCQKILGFEALEAGGVAGGGGSSDNTGSAGKTGTGTGTSGVACDDTSGCAKGLTCLYGFCRAECVDDTECAQDSVCLFHGAVGGCRLASETC